VQPALGGPDPRSPGGPGGERGDTVTWLVTLQKVHICGDEERHIVQTGSATCFWGPGGPGGPGGEGGGSDEVYVLQYALLRKKVGNAHPGLEGA
jgi:hypothetical protein